MSLTLITPVNDVFRRDLDVADTTLLDPLEAGAGGPPAVGAAFAQGEWLIIDASGELIRHTGAAVIGSFQLFTQPGDGAAQALGKATVLQLHEYEAETDMFNSALTYLAGEPLKVALLNIDGIQRAGLTNAAVVAKDIVVGFVTQTPLLNANSMLRFQKCPPYSYGG